MFFLFKKRTKPEHQDGSYAKDKLATGLVQKCIEVKSKWADYLQRKTNKLSSSTKKYCLLLFCFLSVTCSIWLIVQSFDGTKTKRLIVVPISVPAHPVETGEEKLRSYAMITRKEFLRLERFRRYMDSLGGSLSGLRIRDSMLLARPKLMDSIRLIEYLYRLQSPK